MEKLSWEVRKVKLSDLTPLENNPFGKVTEEKRKRLRESLQRLGDFQIATVDTDFVLLTANKRFFALKELGETETQVKFPSRKLTEEERKEIIVSSNLHEGDWIAEILERDYQDIDLKGIGLELDSLVSGILGSDPKPAIAEPEYPIVAKFSEKHSAIIVVVDNEIDLNHLQQILQLESEGSYKSQATGQSYVITAKRLMELWKSKS
jgi:hypothetical protein